LIHTCSREDNLGLQEALPLILLAQEELHTTRINSNRGSGQGRYNNSNRGIKVRQFLQKAKGWMRVRVVSLVPRRVVLVREIIGG
jgi:hypothetical protein